MRKKEKWLYRSVRSMSRIADPPKPKKYISGEIFTYLGNQYNLEILKEKRRYVEFELRGNKCILHIPLRETDNESLVRSVERWYREQALRVFKERVSHITPVLNKTMENMGYSQVKSKIIKIRQFRSRWGSCHVDGTIVLNWRLIFAPLEIVDHVITHELIHLNIKSHSKEFWRVVGTVIPDYLEKEEWLRVNAPSLTI